MTPADLLYDKLMQFSVVRDEPLISAYADVGRGFVHDLLMPEPLAIESLRGSHVGYMAIGIESLKDGDMIGVAHAQQFLGIPVCRKMLPEQRRHVLANLTPGDLLTALYPPGDDVPAPAALVEKYFAVMAAFHPLDGSTRPDTWSFRQREVVRRSATTLASFIPDGLQLKADASGRVILPPFDYLSPNDRREFVESVTRGQLAVDILPGTGLAGADAAAAEELALTAPSLVC